MNCLDTFCISHFEEKDNFIQIKDKGLLFDKADFSVNSYKSNECKIPSNPDKAASSSSKGKKKVNDCIDPFKDDLKEEVSEEDNKIALGDNLCLSEDSL
jgi:hypothetical protein